MALPVAALLIHGTNYTETEWFRSQQSSSKTGRRTAVTVG
jgi:hypothetical protein